jgi:hypothetical protein
MKCPSCTALTKKGASFCSYCGCQLPIVVGVSFPYGLRFPFSTDPAMAAAVTHARRAPRYFIQKAGAARLHVALYDRPHADELAELHRLVFAALYGRQALAIEHTVDGRSFFTGPSFWVCMARRLGGDLVQTFEVPHPGARCHSLFGCLAAQKRQPEMYHREGWEVFYPGRHGQLVGRERFVLDRDKVRAETMNLIKRAGAHRCPLFSASHFDKAIRGLPSVVFIGEDPGWALFDCAVHGPAVRLACYGGECLEIEAGGD